MRLSKAVRIECLQPHATCSDKAHALQEAARLARQCPELANIPEERILKGFQDREALSSTGIGEGVAIPHCRIPGVKDFVVGMITLETPIAFDSIDRKKVSIIAFIVGPESDTEDHPRILSGISLRLGSPEGREKVLATDSREALFESLQIQGTPKIDDLPRREKRMVQIIVQDSHLFHRILEAIESIDETSVIVLDSTNANEHLTRLPVFASFLADERSQFSRMILSLVPRALTNETLRRIEAVTGPLDDRKDVAVIVQDIFLSLGALGV